MSDWALLAVFMLAFAVVPPVSVVTLVAWLTPRPEQPTEEQQLYIEAMAELDREFQGDKP